MSPAVPSATPLDTAAEQCYSCHTLREQYKLEHCPTCSMPTCGIAPCTSRCKCDKIQIDALNPDTLLADPDFRKTFCLHDKADCKACFLRTRPNISFLQDQRGRCIYASPSILAHLGLKVSTVVGHTLTEICEPRTAAELREMEQEVRRTKEVQTRIVEWHHADGHKMMWMVRKTILPNGLLMGVAVDITVFAEQHYSHDVRKYEECMSPLRVLPRVPTTATNGFAFPLLLLIPAILKLAIHVIAKL